MLESMVGRVAQMGPGKPRQAQSLTAVVGRPEQRRVQLSSSRPPPSSKSYARLFPRVMPFLLGCFWFLPLRSNVKSTYLNPHCYLPLSKTPQDMSRWTVTKLLLLI
jgi:hypothetical protein